MIMYVRKHYFPASLVWHVSPMKDSLMNLVHILPSPLPLTRLAVRVLGAIAVHHGKACPGSVA